MMNAYTSTTTSWATAPTRAVFTMKSRDSVSPVTPAITSAARPPMKIVFVR